MLEESHKKELAERAAMTSALGSNSFRAASSNAPAFSQKLEFVLVNWGGFISRPGAKLPCASELDKLRTHRLCHSLS